MANIYTFSVQQVQIAAYSGGGSYGMPYILESTKTISFAEKTVSDKAMGNTKVTSVMAQAISVDLSLDTAGLDPQVLAMLVGSTVASSGSDVTVSVTNQRFPYFGLIAQTWPDDGDVLLFMPYCKVTTDFSWKFEFGKIVVPQFKAEAINDPTLNFIWKLYERPTIGAITFPPTV